MLNGLQKKLEVNNFISVYFQDLIDTLTGLVPQFRASLEGPVNLKFGKLAERFWEI